MSKRQDVNVNNQGSQSGPHKGNRSKLSKPDHYFCRPAASTQNHSPKAHNHTTLRPSLQISVRSTRTAMRFTFILPRFALIITMSRSRAAIRRRPFIDPPSRWPASFTVRTRPHDVAWRWTLNIPADRLALERMALADPFQIPGGDARRIADRDRS